MITAETFMGRGRDLGDINSNFRVFPGTPRVLVFNATVPGLRMTFDQRPYAEDGGPYHIFVNEGLHDVIVYDNVGRLIGDIRRQSATIAFGIKFSYGIVWRISDAEGGQLKGLPIRCSSEVINCSDENLNASYRH